MRDAIKKVILSGATVTYPYKKNMKSWYVEIKIYMFGTGVVVTGGPITWELFDDVDVAVDSFCKAAYNRRNLATAMLGIQNRNLTDKDFDEMTEPEIKALIIRYWKEFFDQDYVFAKEKLVMVPVDSCEVVKE